MRHTHICVTAGIYDANAAMAVAPTLGGFRRTNRHERKKEKKKVEARISYVCFFFDSHTAHTKRRGLEEHYRSPR